MNVLSYMHYKITDDKIISWYEKKNQQQSTVP